MNDDGRITTSESRTEIRFPVDIWDYYAAAALTGLLAHHKADEFDMDEHVGDAAIAADAMLAEREKRREGKGEQP